MEAHFEWEAQFLRGVLDSIPDSAVILDSSGTIIQVNRTWVNFAIEGNLSDPSYFVGKNYLDVCDNTVGEERSAALEVAAGIRAMLNRERSDFYVEYPCHSPSEQRWYMARFGRFEYSGQLYIVIMHVNITDRVVAEQKTLKYRSALEITRRFSEFIRMTAHEFRTPLTLIISSLELYRRQADQDRRDQYVAQIDEQALHLTQLTEQLSLLSSMNREDSLDITLVDCNQLAENIYRLLNWVATTKQITFTCDLDPNLKLINGDDYKLQFALRELLENALRYSPAGASVSLCTRQSDSQVIIEVRDTGIGISQTHLKRIFEPYFKADPSRTLNKSGMGLGLTFVQMVIEMHRGHIEVESTLHQGSTFRLFLPRGTSDP